MDFNQVLNSRKSHRAFLPKKVDHFLIDQLIDAAMAAPVSCNLQVTQFVVVDDEDILAKLGQQVSYKFKYAPCCIVVLYDPRVTVERASVISSSAMAVENILLKAVDLGLGTCPMAGFGKDQIIKNILKIPSEIEILLLVAVGYPDESVLKMPVPRVEKNSIYSYNSYGQLRSFNLSTNLDQHSVEDIINYRRRISPVYLDRFRLNTISEKYYNKVLDYFSTVKGELKKIVDILSYDGHFLKLLKEKNYPGLSIVSSDYLRPNLEFFEKSLNVSGVLIDNKNKFNLSDKADMATLIFQDSFTPELPKLLSSIKENLSDQGVLLIAEMQDMWHRRAAEKLKKVILKWLYKKHLNIYENNKYYKIGPKKYLSTSALKSKLIRAGFKEVKIKQLYRNNKAGVKLICLVAKNND